MLKQTKYMYYSGRDGSYIIIREYKFPIEKKKLTAPDPSPAGS